MNNKLGEFIRAKRGNKSLRQFAKECGNLSHTHIDSIEKGADPRTGKQVSLTLDTLEKIAKGTNTSVQYLVSLATNENNTTFTTTETTKKPELSKRVKKEITEELENFRESLLTADGLMFDGEPASEEDVEKLLDAMQVGMEMIRLRNKEKFTPKKYKK